MSLIFEGDLDAIKLNRFQQNFNFSLLRAYADHPKCHQGHQPQSGMPIIIIDSSNICSNVIDLWGWSCFKHSFLRACEDHQKHLQGHHPQSGSSKSSSNPGRSLEIPSIFEGILIADNPKHILYPKPNWGRSEPKLSLFLLLLSCWIDTI